MNLAFHIELGVRIIIGTLLAGLIGFERDVHGRPAGLKTHVIVGLASATFMVVSTQLWDLQHYHAGQTVGLDPSRIAAAVVTGVGFLGGGAILRTGPNVLGLTTAAGLWLVAAIGLCAGGGFYPEAFFVTVLGLFALTVLRRFERTDLPHRHLVLSLDSASPSLEEIMRTLEAHTPAAAEVAYQRKGTDNAEMVFDLRWPEHGDTKKLVEDLDKLPGLRVVSVGRPGSETA